MTEDIREAEEQAILLDKAKEAFESYWRENLLPVASLNKTPEGEYAYAEAYFASLLFIKLFMEKEKRIDELQQICAEAYQVIGVLSWEAGRFGDDEVDKILDNLSDQQLVHEDCLPFPCKNGFLQRVKRFFAR